MLIVQKCSRARGHSRSAHRLALALAVELLGLCVAGASAATMASATSDDDESGKRHAALPTATSTTIAKGSLPPGQTAAVLLIINQYLLTPRPKIIFTSDVVPDRVFNPAANTFTVAAVSTSPSPAVVFSSRTPTVCTVSGSTVTVIAAAPACDKSSGTGCCSIAATQAATQEMAEGSAEANIRILKGVPVITESVSASSPINAPGATLNFGASTSTAGVGLNVTVTSNPAALDADGQACTSAFPSGSNSICSVAGSTVSLVGGGAVVGATCRFALFHPETSNWRSACSTGQVEIGKARETISLSVPASQQRFSSAPFAISAIGTSSSQGLQFVSESPLVCSVQAAACTDTPPVARKWCANVTMINAGGTGTGAICKLRATQAADGSVAAAEASQSVTLVRGISDPLIDDPGAQYFREGRPFLVRASSSAGTQVQFSARGACKHYGTDVRFGSPLPAGVTEATYNISLDEGIQPSCTIVATTPGNDNYENGLAERDVMVGAATTVTGSAVAETLSASSDAVGRYVAYQTVGASSDVFVLDSLTGQKHLINVVGSQPITGASTEPSLSADGELVAFVAASAAIPKLDNETMKDYLHRRGLSKASGGPQSVCVRNFLRNVTTQCFPAGSAQPIGSPTSSTPVLAPDGRSIVMTRPVTNGAEGTLGQSNIYRAPITRNGDGTFSLGAPSCVTCKTFDPQGVATATDSNGESRNAVVSANGTWLAFESSSKNILSGAVICPQAPTQLFLRNITTGQTRPVGGPSSLANCSSGSSTKPSIDFAGRMLVFQSDFPLTAQDTNGVADVFALNLGRNEMIRVSQGIGGGQATAASSEARISGDGATVSFASSARNLDPDSEDSGVSRSVHVARLGNGSVSALARLTRDGLLQTSDRDHSRPVLNYSGTKLMFDSAAGSDIGGGQEDSVAADQTRVFQTAPMINENVIFDMGFE